MMKILPPFSRQMRDTWFRSCSMLFGSALLALFVIFLAVPLSSANAQYKNNALGLDANVHFSNSPGLIDADNSLKSPDQRPLRLAPGIGLGGESNFKMSADHWWFSVRLNGIFYRHRSPSDGAPALERQYDSLARDTIGTLLGLQGQMGVRYVFLTDRVRPYLQTGLSFTRLISFSNSRSEQCTVNDICVGGSFSENFLTHPNIGGVHLRPGIEWLWDRDIGVHFYADIQRWIVFNADDNLALSLGGGIISFL